MHADVLVLFIFLLLLLLLLRRRRRRRRRGRVVLYQMRVKMSQCDLKRGTKKLSDFSRCVCKPALSAGEVLLSEPLGLVKRLGGSDRVLFFAELPESKSTAVCCRRVGLKIKVVNESRVELFVENTRELRRFDVKRCYLHSIHRMQPFCVPFFSFVFLKMKHYFYTNINIYCI